MSLRFLHLLCFFGFIFQTRQLLAIEKRAVTSNTNKDTTKSRCNYEQGGRLFGHPDKESAGDQVRDEDYSASSYYAESRKPHFARINNVNTEDKSNAWCPKQPLVPFAENEWIQLSLNQIFYVKIINTLPRVESFAGEYLGEFTKKLKIKYKRELNDHWKTYELVTFTNGRINRTEIIKGNNNIDDLNFISFSLPLIAKYIRIFPINPDPNPVNVCLKFEMFGCTNWTGVVSYSMPQGHSSSLGNFSDMFYDGKSEVLSNNRIYLRDGIGQLTDGIRSAVSPLVADDNEGNIRGFRYVGWNLDQLQRGQPYVDIEFKFDAVRRFDALEIDISNDHSPQLNARLFRKATISFSIGGEYYNDYVNYDVKPDTMFGISRPISIPLGEKVAKFIKVRLFLDTEGKWMLISEVYFVSQIVKNPPPPETSETGTVTLPPKLVDVNSGGSKGTGSGSTNDGDKGKVDTGDNKMVEKPNAGGGGVVPPNNRINEHVDTRPPFGPGPQTRDNESTYIIIIVSCLFVAMLLMSIIGALCFRRRRLRKKHRSLTVQAHKHDGQVHLDFTNGHPTLSINGKTVINGTIYSSLPNSDDESSGGMQQSSTGHYTYVPNPRTPQTAREYASTTIYTGNNAGSSPPPPYGNHNDMYTMGMGTYARPKIISNPIADIAERGLNAANGSRSAIMSRHAMNHNGRAMTLASSVHSSPLYISGPGGLTYSSHIPSIPPPVPRFPSDLSIQGGSGNNVYASPADLHSIESSAEDLALLEVSRESLLLKERLGGGQFGEVRLAQWQPSPEEDGILVAVKTLRTDASSQARSDFRQEMRILSQLEDPNIVRVLGVVSNDSNGPLCILVEYMQYGDLHQFLRYRVPADVCNNLPSQGQPTLSYGCLIFLAAQIASGMKYLESKHLVHRDLACRNCLVGSRFQVKISDFGMSRSLYSADYYRVEGRAVLPIRWMAWEAVLFGKFTTGSDVWSFAVTLWEILNFCRQQPFSALTDEEVIRNCGQIYHTSNQMGSKTLRTENHVQGSEMRIPLLPCPPMCPREIYDLMCECWNREVNYRPSFREIHMFLLRKNMGYTPSDDSLLSGGNSDSLSSLTGPM